ncbi:hypothetical protein BR93DRAFT_937815 [Coniochaeta sp. PMI_546]|nr:hypothetical protein BR93DRAFT_937815 [Coniochaeta sp. PMI_546]
MASPSATTATSEFPSFETLFDAAGHAKPGEAITFPVVSLSLHRLRWSLNGPLETSNSVMAHRKISPNLPPDEPYYQPTLSGNGTAGRSSGSWHPISQESLVEPKVSSIIVEVNELDLWEELATSA